jgi:hypothetical protein
VDARAEKPEVGQRQYQGQAECMDNVQDAGGKGLTRGDVHQVRLELFKIALKELGYKGIVIQIPIWVRCLLPIEVDSPDQDSRTKFI